ncbi:hypothetical protein ABT160_32950 [Streptomyces sp. NPDC001941]|uniref:terpene synthase family protein n=1 Tax=Streptomyces sp. NPDC001941 TaxID=3154659 RepID=UPI00332949C7
MSGTEAVAIVPPLPAAVRARDQAMQEHLAWMQGHGLLRASADLARHRRHRLAELAWHTYPEATGEDLRLGYDVIGWLYAFDDLVDDPATETKDVIDHTRRLCHVLFAAEAPSTVDHCAYTRSFHDLWSRSQEPMPRTWRARAAFHWERYFSSQPYAMPHGSQGLATDPDEYLELRRGSSGSEVVLDLAERLQHFCIPPPEYHSTALRRLRRITVDLLNLTNDLHSAAQEAAAGGRQNMVLLTQAVEGVDRTAARAHVGRMVDTLLAEFAAVRPQADRLAGRPGSAARASVEAMWNWIHSYDAWGRQSDRYRNQRQQ